MLHVTLLGTAAGGGFPQWNCRCPGCAAAREGRARPRTQSSVAVSADGARWFLLNASPDVREQAARLPMGEMGGVRGSPVEGVVLTDAELDHTLGLLLLREGRRLAVWGPPDALAVLERDSRILPVLRAFAEVAVTPLEEGEPVVLRHRDGTPAGISVEAFVVAGDAPRFARDDGAWRGTIGLEVRATGTTQTTGTASAASTSASFEARGAPPRFQDATVSDAEHHRPAADRTTIAGGALLYLPGCAALDDALLARIRAASLVLVDGTLWRDDELPRLGAGTSTGADMGHLPVSGDAGSLARLAPLAGREGQRGPRIVYVHLNNTNPMLLEDSPERAAVLAAGLAIGEDGMRFAIES